MSAVVTDQFRIFNAENFVNSVLDTNNSYYVFLGFSNPSSPQPGFGRTTPDKWPLEPTDNFQYEYQYRDTSLFGKRINSKNIRRVIRKVQWTTNTPYDMYRHDYSSSNKSEVTKSGRLYDSNYYVINSDYNVYICIDNGSDLTTTVGNSQDEPTFTDLEPSAAGTSNDGYIWKYLFTVSPSDIVKFDSTEYIVVPNDWATTSNSQIQNVREAGDSEVNFNQIKKVYIADQGNEYNTNDSETCNILGDGSGAKVLVTTDSSGKINSTTVTAGGSGYTYGIVDLGPLQPLNKVNNFAKLIPIIPPSRGHGYDIYQELGADKVLVYARFDDSTKDFPTDAKFSQVGIIKNPSTYSSKNVIYTGSEYSSLGAIKLTPSDDLRDNVSIGSTITQANTDGTSKGYLASYDQVTGVIKYYQDRSLYFGNDVDETDYSNVSTESKVVPFTGDASIVFTSGGPSDASVENFSGSTYTIGNQEINLGVEFTGGVANPEINKTTGDVIYIDNRKLVTRDSRQKEDIKIILEF